MNYALMISCSIEEKLADVERGNSWTQAQEVQAYERCLKEVLEENGKAWAAGNVRVGDYILLSRFPSQSFHRCGLFFGSSNTDSQM